MIRKDYLPFGRPNFSDEEIAAVTRVMRSGWVGMGSETEAFEKELQSFIGAPHVVTVNSCTSALFLSLLIHGVGPGDEVICPSVTWCSTANAALYLGAKPIFCDVERETFCASPETILPLVTPRTKAVIVVHLAGLAVDVKALRKVLPAHVAIVEDAAHALGAKYPDGTPVGSSGNLTCYSFYANKNLSTGEGGAVALFDEAQADHLRSLRQHGLRVDAWKRFTHAKTILMSPLTELGYKMNYTDLQACIGRVQLRRQKEFHDIRLNLATRYFERLSRCVPQIRFQKNSLHDDHARHLLLIELPIDQMKMSRDELLRALRECNIGATVHYAPLNKMPLYSGPGPMRELPNTDYICERTLTLPISASMTPEDVDYVSEHLENLIFK